MPELRSACDLTSGLIFQSNQPVSVAHWWSHVCEGSLSMESVRQGQKKGSFDRDQLKPLLGNNSLALESYSAVCNIFPGPGLSSTEVGGRPQP